MTAGKHDDDLVTDEGVDEGSAASTAEGPGSGADPAAGATRPATGQEPAGPLDVETADVTAARRVAPGQELAEGEG